MEKVQENPPVTTLDRLEEEARRFLLLMEDRQTGLATWHMMLHERLKTIHDLLCPHFEHK